MPWRLLKGSPGWGRRPSKVERRRRQLARRVGLPQQQLNCHVSSPTEPCADWQRAYPRALAPPSPRSDHARFQMTVSIVYGDFNGEDSVSCIGGWGDASNPPLKRSGVSLCADRQFLPQTYPTQNIVRSTKGYFYATDIG